jgi:YVTN family beta-propeller protein
MGEPIDGFGGELMDPPRTGDAAAGAGPGSEEIRAFLIADVRGYTRYTQEHGDEAAAALASRFAALVRSGVEAAGGRLVELRGDEALAVFGSPRRALRAAVALQARFLEETVADPGAPLGVGIGVDAGEAVTVEGGYRGGPLNLAARLCSLAGPGEILASQEVVHLARKIEGITYVERGRVEVKGLSEPVHVMKVVSEAEDPSERFAALRGAQAQEAGPRVRALLARYPRLEPVLVGRRPVIGGVAIAMALLLIASFAAVRSRGVSGSTRIAADAVGVIDLTTGDVTDQIEVGARPGAIAFGAGAIWIANRGDATVSRIDPTTNAVVDTIPVGADPIGIAFGHGALWVTNGTDERLSRIDPATNTVVQSIIVGNGPGGIAVSDDAVWVANRYDDAVVKIEPASGDVSEPIEVGDAPGSLAVNQQGIWVSNQGAGTVSRIDEDAGEVVEEFGVGGGPEGIAVGEGAVWVANSLDGTVARIDPTTGSVTAIRVGEGPSGIALSRGAVWVTDGSAGTVLRIDPDAQVVAETIDVGSLPEAPVVAEGALWVTAASSGGHRGGTFTLYSGTPGLDPAVAYEDDSWQLLSVTNDGLVEFERTGGASGANLVPNLATALPRPTNRGTSYTFRLREGVRYSTGRPVMPDDVRWALKRAFLIGPHGRQFYSGIVGAGGCSRKTCDLSRGIVTDEAERSITFRLNEPDPEFLYKLALPFAYPLPSGIAPREVGLDPVPATGPYMIASLERGQQIELVRNPEFQVWSTAAQPGGYADEIVVRLSGTLDQQVTQVEQGEADFVRGLPPDRVAELRPHHASRLRPFVHPTTDFMSLNTDAPPFDDVRVRRALNYAVDRKKIVELYGGPEFARATCQVLPPNFPGFRPYCPYTIDPSDDGAWTAPNLSRARELISDSGTAGMEVRVWQIAGQRVSDELGDYFVDLLERLGYRASLRGLTDLERYFGALYGPDRPDIAFEAWFADYPSASTFIVPLHSCEGEGNSSGFCDPQIDRLAERAAELQVTDQEFSRRLWARVEARIVDQAPWIPLVNPRLVALVSERVGNDQYHPLWNLLMEQVWVR